MKLIATSRPEGFEHKKTKTYSGNAWWWRTQQKQKTKIGVNKNKFAGRVRTLAQPLQVVEYGDAERSSAQRSAAPAPPNGTLTEQLCVAKLVT